MYMKFKALEVKISCNTHELRVPPPPHCGQRGQSRLDSVHPQVGAGRVVPRSLVLDRVRVLERPQADAAFALMAVFVVGGRWLKFERHIGCLASSRVFASKFAFRSALR